MNIEAPRLRQLVDWPAAIKAGVISGLVFLILNIVLVSIAVGSNGNFVIRYLASVLLGKGILPPPEDFSLAASFAALVATLFMAIVFSCIIAYIVHRGGIIAGVVGGAVLGLAFYMINFYTLTLLFPWFFALTGWTMAINHIIFGALAGGIYEGLEEEIFVPVEQ